MRAAGRVPVWASFTVEVADRLMPNPRNPIRLPPNPCIATLEALDDATGRAVLLHPGTTLRQIVPVTSTIRDER